MIGRLRSVRVRLTLWYTFALAAILLIFAVGVYVFARNQLFGQIRQQLDRDLAVVTRQAESEPDELEELDQHGTVQFFAVRDGNALLHPTPGWQRLQFGDVFETSLVAGTAGSLRGADGRWYQVGVGAPAGSGGRYRVAVAEDEEGARRALGSMARTLALGYPLALLLAVGGGYLLAGRLLAPVGSMARKADEITADRLNERLPVENPNDEFGRLAAVFNRTLGRLQDSFERLRRFTADASHELRTPLTAMRSVGEVVLRDQHEATAYRDAIGSMLEEVDRLTRLAESLLLLTRADSNAARATRQPLDLAALARDVVEHVRALADEKSQTIDIDLAAAAIVPGDRLILRQALMNLLDNAIKYTPLHGVIRVKVASTSDGDVTLEVRDNGPGIPREEQTKVFERFYRVDKARSRELGGAGLGLAIAKWAVEVNGGRIELDSAIGRGSTFRIVLPAAPTESIGART
jgi:heavy metal sensor kinase